MLDSLAIEILTYCVIVGVKPSIIRDNFVRVEDERVDVFLPHDINYVNRVALRNLRSAYDSYRSRQFGGRSKFLPLKRGWTIRGKVKLRSGSTIALPPFTEEHYLSQFFSTNSNIASASSIMAPKFSTPLSRGGTSANASWTTPSEITIKCVIDDIAVNYYLKVKLDKNGRALIGQPFYIAVAFMNKSFIKDGQANDGLFLFQKAYNSLDLERNSEDVAAICSTKKGIFLVQVEGMRPGFFDEVIEDMNSEEDTFGYDQTTISNCLLALKQMVSSANKEAKIVVYFLDIVDFPFTLEPGTFQMKVTTDIQANGLSSRLVEIFDDDDLDLLVAEHGYYCVAGIEDVEGRDDLAEKEEIDVKAAARMSAREKRRERKSKSSGGATVDSVTIDMHKMGLGERKQEASQESPKTRTKAAFYAKLYQEFRAPKRVKKEDALAFMRAFAVSYGRDERDAALYYNKGLAEMRANKDYYKEEFGAELDELSSTYYALIQAVANVEGVEVRLYEYEDFDGTSLPLRQYEPDRDEPHAIVYVLNDGDAHYALSPHPSLEPDDAEDESEESEDEDNSVSSQESVPKSKRGAVPKSVDVTAPSEGEPPSSIERLKNMLQFPSFFGSSKKSTPSATKASATNAAIVDPRDDSPSLGYNTPALKKKVSSTKKKFSTSKALFGDDDEVNSSARTIGSGNAKKKKKKKKKKTNEAPASPRRQPTRNAKKGGKRY